MDQYLTDPGFTFPETNFPQSHSDPVAGDPIGTPGSDLRGQRMRGIDRSSIAQMQWAMSNLGRITAGETGLRPTWTQQTLPQVPPVGSYGTTSGEHGFSGPSAQHLQDPTRAGLGVPMSDYHRRFASNFQPIADPEPVPLPPWGAEWQNRHMDAPYGYIDVFSGGAGPGAGFGNRFGRP